jgi:hypothetical protein
MTSSRLPPSPAKTLDSAITEPLLRDLLGHWVEARGDRPMPSREDIDPSRIPNCLPHVWIYRLAVDREFYCVLAGEKIREAWGHSIMNKSAAEILGSDYETVVKERWNRVLNTPAIQHGFFRNGDQYKNVERIALPISDANGRPIQVIGGSIYRYDTLSARELPVLAATNTVHFYDTRDLVRIA